MPARGWCVLWMLFVTGCATSRTWRLDTGEGPAREYTPRTETPPVSLDGDTFEETVRTLARGAPVPKRPRASLGVVSVNSVRVSQGGSELEAAYGRWCVR
ncbi:hypothetical protein D7X55_39730, partial [Corallococcus sp. AB049A]